MYRDVNNIVSPNILDSTLNVSHALTFKVFTNFPKVLLMRACRNKNVLFTTTGYFIRHVYI